MQELLHFFWVWIFHLPPVISSLLTLKCLSHLCVSCAWILNAPVQIVHNLYTCIHTLRKVLHWTYLQLPHHVAMLTLTFICMWWFHVFLYLSLIHPLNLSQIARLFSSLHFKHVFFFGLLHDHPMDAMVMVELCLELKRCLHHCWMSWFDCSIYPPC